MFSLLISASIASAVAMNQGLPSPVALQDLTVPASRLPAGCGLSAAASVIDGNRVRGGMWAGLEIPTNPWAGTDRRIIASIVERMGGAPLVPDAPLSASERARYRLRLADGIEDAYAAIYTSSDSALVVVYALRPASGGESFAVNAIRRRRDAFTAIDIGPITAVVTGNAGACSRSVEAHVRSLAAKQ